MAGSLTVSNWTLIGAGANGSTGIYNLADTTTTGGTFTGFGTGLGSLTSGAIFVSDVFGGNSSGVFNINTSGTIATTFNLIVGRSVTSGQTGVLNLDAGTVNVGAAFQVGAGNDGGPTFGGNGTVNQSGGAIAASGLVVVGFEAATNGTYNMTGGTLGGGGEFWVGQNGTGTFNQSGGTVSSAQWFVIGRDNGGVGTYNLSGGTVNAATVGGETVLSSFTGGTSTLNVSGGTFNATNNLWVGEGGSGTVNLSGTGLVQTKADGFIQLARGGGGTGTLNLNGGTLQVGRFEDHAGTATFNFNGGTLKASQSSAVFMTANAVTRANVRNGGAVIDTNGFNITVAQALVHSNLGGDNAIDGGLTKRGAGTLTLTGANTFTGDVVIEAGTLSINSAFIHSDADVYLFSGAIFDLNFGGQNSISSLFINGVAQSIGTWGAVGSGATFESEFFTGSGLLNVTLAAIPEPSSFAAVLGAAGLLGAAARRRRRA